MGFTGFYWVLPGFTGFYLVLPSLTLLTASPWTFSGYYRVLPGFHWGWIRFKWVRLGCTGFYWVLLGFTRFYRVLPSFFLVFTEICPDLPNSTHISQLFIVLPGFDGFYWV